ncbi:hypothetical protein KAR48_07885 [bacterium]|nr:hypothetical protein [bacterium]
MISISKAYADDFDRVSPVLVGFNNQYIDKETRRALFKNQFNGKEDFVGYMMTDDDCVVGFLGLIFSQIPHKGRLIPTCNLTSWIVDEAYRSRSLFLLLPVLKMLEYTITDYTASDEVAAFLLKARFNIFETHYRFLLPVTRLLTLFKSVKCHTDKAYIASQLKGDEQVVFKDHENLNCVHFLFESNGQSCYLILNSLVRKKAPYLIGQILYVGNSAYFADKIEEIRWQICKKLKVLAIFVDIRYLEGVVPPISILRELQNPRLYRSDSLTAADIQNNYSELALFNI